MKKTLLLLILTAFSFTVFGQTPISPLEKALTDSLCSCISKINLDKITNSQEAKNAFTDCFGKRTDLFMELASEKKLDPTDQVAMRQLGIDLAKDLFSQNCSAFTRLSVKMAETAKSSNEESEETLEGNFKRIDLKGFNYIVLSGKNGSEISFLWLTQFPGSEKFMANTTIFVGKKLKVNYREMEVYIPLAKGYYKVKVIYSVDVL